MPGAQHDQHTIPIGLLMLGQVPSQSRRRATSDVRSTRSGRRGAGAAISRYATSFRRNATLSIPKSAVMTPAGRLLWRTTAIRRPPSGSALSTPSFPLPSPPWWSRAPVATQRVRTLGLTQSRLPAAGGTAGDSHRADDHPAADTVHRHGAVIGQRSALRDNRAPRRGLRESSSLARAVEDREGRILAAGGGLG